MHPIRVPDLGEGIAEVELVAWRVAPGDMVAEDQPLADVMTDKATVEIPSPVAGRVLALGGEVGQLLAVGAELIRIEVVSAVAAPQGPAPASTAALTSTASTASTASTVAPIAPVAPPSPASPPWPASPVLPAATPASAPPPAPSGSLQRPIASPAVRARAWELGIDLHDVAATGTAGRIMQADLDAHLERLAGLAQRTPQAQRSLPAAPTSPDAASAANPAAGDEATQVSKIIGLRRKIAQKMQESKRRIPHFTYVEEVDVSELEALRAQLNQRWAAQRGHLTLLALLIRALVLAVKAQPQVNARLDDEAGLLTQYAAVHLGIATQTDAGLMVPVLRHAQRLDLWASAAEVLRLADGARKGRLSRDELSGSTITLSSLGRLGGIVSTPVINHPEVAIVGVNRIVLRPVLRDGAIVARQMMNLSSSFDHRVVDGQHAAAFVQQMRELLESPATLFVA